MGRLRAIFACSVIVLSGYGSASAQDRPQEQRPSECPQAATPTPPATPSTPGRDGGTAPGGMGSTAWSGGTGGSYIGTHPAAPTPASPNEHPDTARGLDPTRPSPSNPPPSRC